MSIASEITRLQNAKAALKTSIEAKGVTVASDATLDTYHALVDEIPQGGGSVSVEAKDVNFYDYDGTRTNAYTAQEFAALSAMPNNPDHTDEGLTAQGWNWSLSDAKEYVSNNGALEIGQNYVPTDGKTKFFITIDDIARPTVTIYLQTTVANGATIDWGDGSPIEQSGQTGSQCQHSYDTIGDYVIAIDIVSGQVGANSNFFRGECNNYRLRKCFLGSSFVLASSAFSNNKRLEAVSVPSPIPYYDAYVFNSCAKLKYFVYPNGSTKVQNNTFSYCSELLGVSYPKTMTSISTYPNCTSLRRITIPPLVTTQAPEVLKGLSLDKVVFPNTTTEISAYALYQTKKIASIRIPSGVTSIGTQAFDYCSDVKYFYVEPTTPPSIFSNTFNNGASDVIIYVPAASVEDYKAATNWSNYASKIQAMPSV